MLENGEERELGDEGGIQVNVILSALFEKLRRYHTLLIVLIVLFSLLSIGVAAIVKPSYTATAVVGPPSSSLSASGLSGSSLGGLASLASHIGGGGLLGQQSDSFSIYTELLTSDRLAAALTKNKGILETIFYRRYDSEHHRWIPQKGPLRVVINLLKDAFRYPIKARPDQDDLARYLSKHLSVDTKLTSSFVSVSFKFHDPREAENILKTILVTADNIVREDMRADVAARLDYLAGTLPTVTQADQRNALISVLSSQQQLMMMISADKRFASDFVDPPHADQRPTFPSAGMFAVLAILVSILVWGVFVFGLRPEHPLLVKVERVSAAVGRSGGVKLVSWVRRGRGSESW